MSGYPVVQSSWHIELAIVPVPSSPEMNFSLTAYTALLNCSRQMSWQTWLNIEPSTFHLIPLFWIAYLVIVFHGVYCSQKRSLEEKNFAVFLQRLRKEQREASVGLINSIYRLLIIPHIKPQALPLYDAARSKSSQHSASRHWLFLLLFPCASVST